MNLFGVKHLCHLPFLLLLRDPGLPAGLPAGLEATEEGQDLGLDSIFISYYELFRYEGQLMAQKKEKIVCFKLLLSVELIMTSKPFKL